MGSEFQMRTFPEIVYANDGTKYYPCKYCCRAFAHKRYLTLHMRACVKNELHHQQQQQAKFDKLVKVKKESSETIDLTAVKKKSSEEVAGATKIRAKQLRAIAEDNKMQTRRPRKLLGVNRCKICTLGFANMDELIMHAKIEHNQRSNSEKGIFPPEELEYFYTVFLKSNKTTCPICSKPIGNKLNWKRHLYTHSSVKRFECHICKKTFSRSDHCKYHEKRHKIDLKVFMSDAD